MKTNVTQIFGNWDLGFALDKHVLRSECVGHNAWGHPVFDTTRSESGEALYQLKYQNDRRYVAPLANAFVSDIFPHFDGIGLIVPMPASKIRNWQPVSALADEIGTITNIPVFHGLLSKAPTGQALKDLKSKQDRVDALAGKIQLHDAIRGNDAWNVVLIDDRYDTGASVEAACSVLRNYAKISNIYVATATW